MKERLIHACEEMDEDGYEEEPMDVSDYKRRKMVMREMGKRER